MNRRVILAVLAAAAIGVRSTASAGIVVAGPITGGSRLPLSNSSAPGITTIGASPVDGDGALNSVTFGWSSAASCSAVKIKVFRLDGSNLDFVGERGPIPVTWNAGGDLTTASLSPTIAVQKGDLLGIAPATTGDCGNAIGWAPGLGTLVSFDSDVTTNVGVSAASVSSGFTLSLFASGSGSGETFAGILTGAGSLQGGAGSNIKTGLQFTNPGFSTITGRLVFHPAGPSAGPNDPSFGFSLDPGRTGSTDDAVAAMGLSGLFTVDIFVANGDDTPLAIACVYNDGGDAGTAGFTEEVIDPAQVSGGEGVSVTGVLLGPPDVSKYRYNIGIRTIGGPVGVFITVRDHRGDVVHTFSDTYPANSYTQKSSHDFLGGFDLDVDESIEITFSGGGAIIYGAMADNISNDPSVQFMRYLRAIA